MAPPANREGEHRTAAIDRSHASESENRAAGRSKWAWLLVPDLALCLAIVTLFYCLVLFNAPQKFFRDSDTGWHIVTGDKILTDMQLPRTDPYSFTRAGQPWFAWEWGADCVMGAAFQRAGLSGVV